MEAYRKLFYAAKCLISIGCKSPDDTKQYKTYFKKIKNELLGIPIETFLTDTEDEEE